MGEVPRVLAFGKRKADVMEEIAAGGIAPTGRVYHTAKKKPKKKNGVVPFYSFQFS